ncbi:hypothetical protein FRC03_011098 [Tulasnella sp. 419]|nr:hypothetical protein FRC03_011098 [Tulasnella sp. 419]
MSNVPYESLGRPDSPTQQFNRIPQQQDISQYAPVQSPPSPLPRDDPFDTHNFPPGAGPPMSAIPPRFMGMAAAHEGLRSSYASSNNTYGNQQDYRMSEYDSVHGLNMHNAGSTPTLATQRTSGNDDPLLHQEAYHDDPHQNGIPMSPVPGQAGFREYMPEKRNIYESPKSRTKRRGIVIGSIILIAILVVAAVLAPVYWFVIRPNSSKSSSNTGGSSTGGGGGHTDDKGSGGDGGNTTEDPKTHTVISGGDGSKIKLENGTEFTYNNKFGGFWYFDPSDPFKSAAKAQSYTPGLNETWDYNTNRIFGVNLGGWLNTEPFISPALYEQFYPNAVDEYTLSQQLAANGGIGQLEDHYKTFITEEDFALIAGAGLNWIRLPIAFWALEIWDGEPFLEHVSWKYVLKAIEWARKYGLRINLDLHAVPGSQNGWNHSGRLRDTPNFLRGVMGLANADRTLDYIRSIAQFISQPQYKDVVCMFGILNEPFTPNIGDLPMDSFNMKAHDLIREITGFGEGNGPIISIHDGFTGIDPWAGKYAGSDRLALDIHPYFAFGQQTADPMAQQAVRACDTWAGGTNRSMGAFGITAAGEFSNAINDCGTYVNGVGIGTRYEATFPGYSGARQGDCSRWTDWTKYTDQDKADIKEFALASMDALTNWFFWTWKIGDTLAAGRVESPFWLVLLTFKMSVGSANTLTRSYKLGLEQGWMPTDPRESYGKCASLGVAATSAPAVPASATGGPGAGTISPNIRASLTQWPVAALTGIPNADVLPIYTPTGPMITLPGPTFTDPANPQKTFDAGNGWFNPADTVGAHVPITGCTYPDAYDAGTEKIPVPSARCTGPGARRRAARSPEPTRN